MKKIALLLIRCYQLAISPYLGRNCRFVPSCSHYARQCFEEKPFWQALKMSITRISKCHPFHPGGYDPVE